MGTGGEIEDEADEDEEGKLLFAVKVDAAQQPNRVGVNMRDRARSWRQSDHSRSSLGPCWPSALLTKGSDPSAWQTRSIADDAMLPSLRVAAIFARDKERVEVGE